MLKAAIALGVLLGVAAPSSAHEKPVASPSPAAFTTTAAPPEATGEHEGGRPKTAPIQLSLHDVLFSHLHNKVVHFPLALGSAGALLLLLSYRRPQFWPAARLLLLVAAASALAAYLTGRAQEDEFEDGALALYLARHQLLGKISGATLALTAALSFAPKARRWLWLLALAILVALSLTGMLGGILSHTEV
jgi:uncharacterized membrane protein